MEAKPDIIETLQLNVAVPRHAVLHPEYFSVNAAGQLMFVPPPGVEFGDALVIGLEVAPVAGVTLAGLGGGQAVVVA